jgi:hypothetical protein
MAFTVVAAVNNEDVLQKNLLRSPELANGGRHQLVTKRGFTSASLAYNSGIDDAEHDVIIFVHQDVYLPDSWFPDLERCLAHLEGTGARWGVLGCFGSRNGATGGLGRIYTRGLGRHGQELSHPEAIETLDEIVLILRKSSGLRFDRNMPHFHLYGADICMEARERGLVNYAFQGFCVHNTNQLIVLPKEFYTCYRYIRAKWEKYLPIYASCMTISMLNGELYRKRLSEMGEWILGSSREVATRVDDPRAFVNDRG